jgi:hypothetical protein
MNLHAMIVDGLFGIPQNGSLSRTGSKLEGHGNVDVLFRRVLNGEGDLVIEKGRKGGK